MVSLFKTVHVTFPEATTASSRHTRWSNSHWTSLRRKRTDEMEERDIGSPASTCVVNSMEWAFAMASDDMRTSRIDDTTTTQSSLDFYVSRAFGPPIKSVLLRSNHRRTSACQTERWFNSDANKRMFVARILSVSLLVLSSLSLHPL